MSTAQQADSGSNGAVVLNLVEDTPEQQDSPVRATRVSSSGTLSMFGSMPNGDPPLLMLWGADEQAL